jgi:ribosome-binding protein aMBF1 (putative translation factor)
MLRWHTGGLQWPWHRSPHLHCRRSSVDIPYAKPKLLFVSDNMSKLFGRVVRKRREARGLSQEELAARAGIHRTYVSSIELGKVRLGLDIAKKVADGLGAALSDLLAEAESTDPRRGGARPKRTQAE